MNLREWLLGKPLDRLLTPLQEKEGGWFVHEQSGDDGGALACQIPYRYWLLTVDIHWSDDSGGRWLRLRCPIVDPTGLRLRASSRLLFSPLSSSLSDPLDGGILTGDEGFDGRFLVRAKRPRPVREILSRPEVQSAMLEDPCIELRIADRNQMFHGFLPPGISLLDVRLPESQGLSEEGAALLLRCCRALLDAIWEVEWAGLTPEMRVFRWLAAPAGELKHEGRILWDLAAVRRQEALTLGRVRDPQLYKHVVDVIDDPDPVLRLWSVRQLEGLGQPAAIPHLLSLLATMETAEETRELEEAAAGCLRSLQAEDRLLALQGALAGEAEKILGVARLEHRQQILDALLAAISARSGAVLAGAARSLAELGVKRAGPLLRQARDRVRGDRETFESIQESLALLNRRASLPLIVSGDDEYRDLPRV